MFQENKEEIHKFLKEIGSQLHFQVYTWSWSQNVAMILHVRVFTYEYILFMWMNAKVPNFRSKILLVSLFFMTTRILEEWAVLPPLS